MRVEIKLTEEVAKAIQEKVESQNHSRKRYIELICINDAKKKIVKPKRNGSTRSFTIVEDFLFIGIRVYDQIIHSILPFVNSLRISFIILSYTLLILTEPH